MIFINGQGVKYVTLIKNFVIKSFAKMLIFVS